MRDSGSVHGANRSSYPRGRAAGAGTGVVQPAGQGGAPHGEGPGVRAVGPHVPVPGGQPVPQGLAVDHDDESVTLRRSGRPATTIER
jgi:hypothetical protein